MLTVTVKLCTIVKEMFFFKELLTSQGRCAKEQQKAELWVPHDGFVEALAPLELTRSTQTRLISQPQLGTFIPSGWALSEDREAQTVHWKLKVHPTLLCGGTKVLMVHRLTKLIISYFAALNMHFMEIQLCTGL